MTLRDLAARSTSRFAHAPFCVALLAALLAFWPAAPGLAQEGWQGDEASAKAPARPDTDAPAPSADRLPAPRVTTHEIALPGGALVFEARAGALTLTDDDGKPEADIGFVAYTVQDAGPDERPVTFVVNGGPGAASAYLHLGVLGSAGGLCPRTPRSI